MQKALPSTSKFSSKPRRTLSRQLMFWFLSLSLLPLLVSGAFGIWQSYLNVERESASALVLSAKSDKATLEQWFADRHKDLSTLVAVAAASEESFRPVTEARDLEKSQTPFYQQYVRRYDYIDALYFIGRSGLVTLAVGDDAAQGINVFSDASFRSELTRAGRLAYLTPAKHFLVFPEETHQHRDEGNASASETHVFETLKEAYFSAPVYDGDGQVKGMIVQKISLSSIFQALQQNKNADYHYYLVNLEDYMPGTSASAASFQHSELSVYDTALFQNWVTEQRKGNQNELFFEIDSNQGAPISVSFVWSNLFGEPWALVSEVESTAVSASAGLLGWSNLAFALFIGMVVAFLASFVSRRITQPLALLTTISEKAATGEKNLRANIAGNNEVARLAQSFNQMLHSREVYEQALESSNRASIEAIEALNEQKFALDQHAIVAITDVRGTITSVNSKFEEISGYDSSELLGNNHRLINSGHHDHDFWREMYLTISKGDVWRAEVCNRAKSGALYWVDTTVVPVMRGGKPLSYVAIRTDISMGKMAEQQLIDAKESAEAGARAKSEFLASMSHEIRTPMNGVLGMLNLLKRTSLDDEQHRQVGLAYGSAESLLTIINDILDFSKIEAGKLDLEMVEFDLIEEIGEFVETTAHRVHEKDLEFIVDLSGVEKSRVMGDPGRIRQILINLVGNAIKFTSQGEIKLSVQLLESYGGKLKLECAIHDSGIGIPADKLSHLCESFSQVDTSTTRKYGGTGLGLTIVKQLCELMGGHIEVSSVDGQGSVFSFAVYLESPDADAPDLSHDVPAELRVLVVDANDSNRLALVSQCEAWGLEASGASDGPSMMARVQGQNNDCAVDVVICDKGLWDNEIQQWAEQLGQDSRYQVLRYVVMPRLLENVDVESLRSNGVSAVLKKPVAPSALKKVFQQLDRGESPIEMSLETSKAGELQASDQQDLGLGQLAKNARILLVEDNPVNQIVASALLEQVGLSCDMAGNGVEALAALKQSPEDMPYHLVLMDCQMPEMDGYEASTKIRQGEAGERYTSLNIIAMTANAMKGDKEKCLAVGMDDYVSKPVHADVLHAKLKQWLELPIELSEPADGPRSTEAEPDEEADASSTPIWDLETALENLGGNEALYEALSEAALEDIPNNIAQLTATIESSNFESARLAAHSIKGVSASLGGMRLKELAYLTEQSASGEDLPSLEKNFALLVSSFDELKMLMTP